MVDIFTLNIINIIYVFKGKVNTLIRVLPKVQLIVSKPL